jgi:L-asparagine transporter-like permease
MNGIEFRLLAVSILALATTGVAGYSLLKAGSAFKEAASAGRNEFESRFAAVRYLLGRATTSFVLAFLILVLYFLMMNPDRIPLVILFFLLPVAALAVAWRQAFLLRKRKLNGEL